MIIDFHTHVFSDKIAKKSISILAKRARISAHSDGTVDGLLLKMKEAGVDISVNLPVITTPEQFDGVNKFAAMTNERFSRGERRIISFAGIHPACDCIEEKMRFIKDSGFLGVKIHPDFQGTFINDPGYIEIVKAAAKYDLIVVTHAGVDIGFRDMPVRCTPKLALELIKEVPHEKMVFAHLGGCEMQKEFIETLAGEDVYIDTAYSLKDTQKDVFLEILKKHGEDKILFASDSPWSDMASDVQILKSYSLGENIEEKILFKNAAKLLGI